MLNAKWAAKEGAGPGRYRGFEVGRDECLPDADIRVEQNDQAILCLLQSKVQRRALVRMLRVVIAKR